MKIFVALLVAFLGVTVAYAAIAKPTCGGSGSTKTIQLLNPAYPPRECLYRINSYSKYVCQLRIDFNMQLAQPTIPSAGNGLRSVQCLTDYVSVGGLRLCGTETSSHIYVPFNVTGGTSSVDIVFSLAARVGATSLPDPSWSFTIKQLECPTGAALRSEMIPETFPVDESELEETSSDDVRDVNNGAPMPRATSFSDGFLLAPPGCLQYYPQSKGVIRSFNFNDGKGVYPGGMNYAICFRRISSTQGLELKSFFFQIGSTYSDSSALAMDNYCYTTQYSSATKANYLMVPQGRIQESNIRATYFCGSNRNQGLTITSTNPGPLMVIFNSDGEYNTNNIGFDFNYKLY